jgi:4-amino-4-deoxy-L-arabinose transferase-like glycosyltransferase
LCLLLYLPGISTIPALDRDEARFAQATRQMLETGDFLRIRFQDEARNKKPAGIYWLQAASVALFSNAEATAIWPYRIPSLLGGTAAAVLTFAVGGALFRHDTEPIVSRRIGATAAILLASAIGVAVEAHIAKSDAALLAAITAGQGALGLAYVRNRTGRDVPGWIAVAFWGAEIAAIFLKGPPGPGLAALTAATLSIADGNAGWLRRLRPVVGIVVMILAIVPWLLAIQYATEGQFLSDSLGHDLLMKLVDAQESHGAPPFSYLLMAMMTFWPGSLLLVPAVSRAWRRHEAPAERFLLAWLIPAWVLLELVPTKLPHYVLPLYPALALLAAAAWRGGVVLRPTVWEARAERATRGLWIVASIGLAVLLVGLPLRFGGRLVPAGLFGAIVLLWLATVLMRWRHTPDRAIALVPALSFTFIVSAALGVLPGIDQIWLSRAAAAMVAAHPPATGKPLVAVGYSEPSLVFMLGTDLRLTTPRGAAETLAEGGEALVSSREEPLFRQAMNARGLNVEPVSNAPGTDYSNGQRMVLTLYAVTPAN